MDEHALSAAVAAELRAEMGRQRISVRELARRIDRPDTTIGRWLRGAGAMTLDDLDALTAALGLDTSAIIVRALQGLPRPDSNREPAGYLESSAPFERATGADSAA